MAPGKAAVRALAQAFYEESRLPAWPDWGELRERTKDLMAAFVLAVTTDRDKPPATRFQSGSRTRTPDPLPDVPSKKVASRRNGRATGISAPILSNGVSLDVSRYAAGSAPDPGSILLAESGMPPS